MDSATGCSWRWAVPGSRRFGGARICPCEERSRASGREMGSSHRADPDPPPVGKNSRLSPGRSEIDHSAPPPTHLPQGNGANASKTHVEPPICLRLRSGQDPHGALPTDPVPGSGETGSAGHGDRASGYGADCCGWSDVQRHSAPHWPCGLIHATSPLRASLPPARTLLCEIVAERRGGDQGMSTWHSVLGQPTHARQPPPVGRVVQRGGRRLRIPGTEDPVGRRTMSSQFCQSRVHALTDRTESLRCTLGGGGTPLTWQKGGFNPER